MINAPKVTAGHWPETPVSLPEFSNCLLCGDEKGVDMDLIEQ